MAPVHFDPNLDVHPAPWISTLARKLVDECGIELSIVNYEPRLPKSEISFKKEGVSYTFLKTPSPKLDHLGFFRKRIAIMHNWLLANKSSYDLIHIHGSEHQYEAAAHKSGIPSVLSMQGVMGECLNRLKEKWNYTHLSWWMSALYERHFVPKMPEFICRTTFDKGFVKSNNPKARIHENWEMIRPEFFRDLGSDKPEYLMYMGGTHPIKGIELLLPAFSQIREKVSIKLKILGKADAEKIWAMIHEMNLNNIQKEDIEFLGFQDVHGVIQAMDESYAMIHTSLIDNSPNSVCEAQVAGLPVISTEVGGIGSLINHGETGLLTTLNPNDIAEKALTLVQDSSLHLKLKQNSKTMARIRHDGDHIASRTMSIYQSVLAEHSAS
jgi:glycosyltransferase involved in cell wall biosynthesis